MPQLLLHMPQELPEDIGHASDLDLKKNGTAPSLTKKDDSRNNVADLMMINFRESGDLA